MAQAGQYPDVDLDAAARRLEGRVHRTPLLHSRLLDAESGRRVWLKAESFQRSGSFKARGAYNAALVGLEAGDRRGLLAISSGNHGQAVALAAAELGLAAVVVMAETASAVKVAGIRGYGAEVVSEGVTVFSREQVAARVAEERGLRMVHPHDDPHVISGQGTVGLELAGQLQRRGAAAPVVLVPLGGGGLLSGVALALRRELPAARLVGVEPVSSNDGQLSLRDGRRVELERQPETAADGAATIRLGERCWEIVRDQVDEIVTVTDEQLGEACRWLWTRCKLVVEPTGALAVAAVLAGVGGSGDPAPTDVACIISGGNCLPDQIADLVARSRGDSPPP